MSFWLGLCGAIVLILDTLSEIIGLRLYSKEVEGIILSICSILVTIGIITKRDVGGEDVSKEDLLKDIDESKEK
jgi:uncharacterized membrane protein